MSEKSDIKKALEEILGYELPEEAIQRIDLFLRVASYTQSNRPGEGFVTKRGIIVPPFKSCDPLELLDVSGVERTGSDGKRVFRLSDFICFTPPGDEALYESFLHPINVVATPLSSEPYFLTILHSLVKNAKGHAVDVEIHVSMWDANGATAPNISFDWRCRVGFPTILF